MDANLRQQKILSLVNQRGFITIDELANAFEVTPQTMRRDITSLAELNQVRRFHGGAASLSSIVNDAYQDRKMSQHQEKSRIAKRVASLIPDQASLFINIGTTNEAIAQALLKHRDLKIITNSLNVAALLSQQTDHEIIIAGGMVRNRDGGITGEATIDFIRQFRTDFGIIGISGIEEDGTLLDFDFHEVRVAQAIVQNARHTILAADATKFRRQAVNKLGTTELIDTLVTDHPPPKVLQRTLRSHNCQLIIAEPSAANEDGV